MTQSGKAAELGSRVKSLGLPGLALLDGGFVSDLDSGRDEKHD